MEILILVGSRTPEASAVLASLDLLPHTVRTAPRDVRTLVSAPSPDAVLVDARSELSEARATCRMLTATGLGVPLIAVVTEAGLGPSRVAGAKGDLRRREPSSVGGEPSTQRSCHSHMVNSYPLRTGQALTRRKWNYGWVRLCSWLNSM